MIRFSISGLYRVFDYGDGTWGRETIDEQSTHSPISAMLDDELSLYVEGVEFPKVEGIYSLWAVGAIYFSRDYFGEYDMDFEMDREDVLLASRSETELAENIMKEWETPTQETMVKFEE